jgi:hypothetical protein
MTPLNGYTPTELQNERRATVLNSMLVTMAQQGRSIATSTDAQFAWCVAEMADELFSMYHEAHPSAGREAVHGPSVDALNAVERALGMEVGE